MSTFTRLLLLGFAGAGFLGAATIVSVPGTADIWLAGMPNNSTASITDSAPDHSPVLVTGPEIVPGGIVTFTVSGVVSNYPTCCSGTADGGLFLNHLTGAENGISDVRAPLSALMGVFLGFSQPDFTPAPAGLDFSGAGGLEFALLAPGLKQVFFIGNGLTSGAAPQQFIVPVGATRLFLGPMDGFEWSNNSGSFRVTIEGSVDPSEVPEPSTSALLGSALVALVAWRCRRRT